MTGLEIVPETRKRLDLYGVHVRTHTCVCVCGCVSVGRRDTGLLCQTHVPTPSGPSSQSDSFSSYTHLVGGPERGRLREGP